MKKHDIIELDIVLKHETELAVLVESSLGVQGKIQKGRDVWLPKSMVEISSQASNGEYVLANISLPEWLAEKNGLI